MAWHIRKPADWVHWKWSNTVPSPRGSSPLSSRMPRTNEENPLSSSLLFPRRGLATWNDGASPGASSRRCEFQEQPNGNAATPLRPIRPASARPATKQPKIEKACSPGYGLTQCPPGNDSKNRWLCPAGFVFAVVPIHRDSRVAQDRSSQIDDLMLRHQTEAQVIARRRMI